MTVFGADAGAFHWCSLLFAIACTLLAFAVFQQLTRRWLLALAAAALFAVYPVHTEAVDWIAALPDLGFSLFLLLLFTVQTRSEATIAARPSKMTLVFLLVYIFCWNLSAYQPRIPFGGLVHYVMHQHWRTDSNL